MKPKTITLTEAEHATVLAALRYWQREGITGDSPPEEDIATNSGEFAPLDADAIDRLCERINTQDPGDVLMRGYLKLHDGLSDMIEGGRLTESDCPDDYQWLVESLADLSARGSAASGQADIGRTNGGQADKRPDMDTYADMIGEYSRWCSAQALPQLSADELLHELLDKTTLEARVQRRWLLSFIARWDAVGNSEKPGT